MTMRKSIALVSILAILLTIIPPLPGRGQQTRQPSATPSFPTPSPTPVGQPTPFPTPAPTPDIDQTPTDNISLEGDLGLRQDTDPVIAAQAALGAQGAIIGRGPDDDFENTDYEQPDELGTDHIRMTQTYQGVHVLGGELIVHMTSDRVTGINGRFVQNLQLSTSPVLSVDEAESSAAADVQLRGGQEILIYEASDEPTLFVFAEGNAPRLARRVRVGFQGEEGEELEDIIVDAINGLTIGRQPQIHRSQTCQNFNRSKGCNR